MLLIVLFELSHVTITQSYPAPEEQWNSSKCWRSPQHSPRRGLWLAAGSALTQLEPPAPIYRAGTPLMSVPGKDKHVQQRFARTAGRVRHPDQTGKRSSPLQMRNSRQQMIYWSLSNDTFVSSVLQLPSADWNFSFTLEKPRSLTWKTASSEQEMLQDTARGFGHDSSPRSLPPEPHHSFPVFFSLPYALHRCL